MFRSKDQICQKGSQAEEQAFFKIKYPVQTLEKKNVMSTKKAKQNDHLLRIKLKGVGGCFDSVPGEFKLICVCGLVDMACLNSTLLTKLK